MPERISELFCKEVINIADGAKLGYCTDAVIETNCRQLTALIVPGPRRFFGILAGSEEYVIPWGCVQKIGENTILVNVIKENVKRPRKKQIFSK